jgi:hypothetical protein
MMALPHWVAYRNADETSRDMRLDDAKFQRTINRFMSCKMIEVEGAKLSSGDCRYLTRDQSNPGQS